MCSRSMLMTCLVVLAATGRVALADGPDGPLLGFEAAGATAQRALEKRFDAQLEPGQLREWMKVLTARPHHVGSSYGKQVADFVAQQLKSWGFETSIEEYQVLFPTPRTRLVELVAPTRARMRLDEPSLKEDGTSTQKAEQLPTYHAYAADGEVEGPVVYVNYGVPKDYEELELRGIDVRGKIVLARYGGSWRGIKPKVAAEHGAIGCLVYSDPRDDGYVQGDVYPKGGLRTEWSAQRGSVMDMPLYPGDPLTPGVGATKSARRLAREEARVITKIPVLPLAWGDALPIMRALAGPVAPSDWRGGLPITYHLGPGAAVVHIKLASNWNLAPAYDVLARLPGAERPDEWVIRGNHHDAWVNGADDPVSGLAAMLAEARAMGVLARGGWRPRRTIVFAAWDAEEPGLIGSTEWVEAHAEELAIKGVAYVNTDNSGRGFLHAGGSHTLEPLVAEIARDVVDPEKGISVAERARSQRLVGGSAEEKKEAADGKPLRLGALGSGSDFSPFLQHAGIASLSFGFGGEDSSGAYHSIYDSFDRYVRFSDADFRYGVALAAVAGRAVLRLANADTLPFDFPAFTETVGRYVKEVAKLADDMRTETEQRNKLIREGHLAAAADPKEPFVAPKPREPVPFLNFAPLENALGRLQRSTRAYTDAAAARAKAGKALSPGARHTLDGILMKSERALTSRDGLPLRPFYRHQIYAPGLYTGYGAKTLPGVREAIEERQWSRVAEQVPRAAAALERFAAEIDRAAAVMVGH